MDSENVPVLRSAHPEQSYGSIEGSSSSSHDTTQHSASNMETLYSIMTIIMGTGVLQLSYSLKQGGWIGLLYIIFAGFIANYSGDLIVRCLYLNDGRRLNNISEIGHEVFGKKGEYVIRAFKSITLFGASSVFILLAGINMNELAIHLLGMESHRVVWIFVSALVVLIPLMLFKEVTESPFLSIYGTFTTVLVIIIIVTLSLVKMLRDPDFIMPRTTSIKLSGLPSSLSSICFAFGGNIVWPDVERGMKKRKSFPKVLSLANLLVAIMYLAMAAAGYALFGDENVQSPITISFGKNLYVDIANFFMAAHVLLAAPMLIISVTNELESCTDPKHFGAARWTMFHTRILRFIFIALSVELVVFLPFFEHLVSLLGSVGSAALIFIIPVVLYMKMYETRVKFTTSDYVKFYGTIAIGLLCLIVGSYTTGLELWEKLRNP